MANFTQPIQWTLPEEYTSRSKPITGPEGRKTDESIKHLFKGMGDVTLGAAQAYDMVVKAKVNEETEKIFRPLKEQHIESLEGNLGTVKNAPGAVAAPETAPVAADYETSSQSRAPALVPMPPTRPVPRELEELPQKLERDLDARANGKISRSEYLKRLYTAAKEYRSQYPTHKDYIDKQISQVTGEDPANAYMKSLIGDINSYMSGANAKQNKVISELAKLAGGPGATDMIQDIYAGRKNINQGWDLVNTLNKDEFAAKQLKNRLAVFEGTRKVEGELAEDAGNRIARATVKNDVVAFNNKYNIDAFVTAWQEGRINTSAPQAVQLRQLVDNQRRLIRQRLEDQFNEVDSVGKSLTTRIGNDKKNKIIDDHLKYYDTLAEALAKDKPEMASYGATIQRAIVDDEVRSISTDKKLGPAMARFGAMEKLAPGQIVKDLFKEQELQGLSSDIKGYVNGNRTRIFTQEEMSSTGAPTTIKKLLEEAASADKNRTADGGAKKYALPQNIEPYFRDVDRIPKLVNSGGEELARNIARSVFSPEGRGLIGKFETDRIQSGKQIHGRYSIWHRFTNPDMQTAMKKLGGKEYEDMKGYMENEFANEILVKEIRALNHLQIHPDLKFEWKKESTTGRVAIEVKYAPSGAMPGSTVKPGETVRTSSYTPKPDMDEAQRIVRRINGAMGNMTHLAKETGTDFEAYMIRLLGTAGVRSLSTQGADTGPRAVMEGIPAKIANSIFANRYGNKFSAEEFEKWSAEQPK